jgi:two-component system, NarL family, nitrate/nitrite response regulator NarL
MMPADRVRILVADDHAMFRDGLKRLVESEDDMHVVGEAGDATEAVSLSRELKPDVLLLDLTMPNGGGLDALRAICSGPPMATRSIMLTGDNNHRGDTIAALQLGARGIVLKTSEAVMLFRSIRAVMNGEYWLWQQNVRDGVEAIRRIMASGDGAKADRYRLTARELEIVPHVAGGASNRDIAQLLSVREDTVKRHLSNIFDKLGVYSRLELALFAINHGLVEPPSALSSNAGLD